MSDNEDDPNQPHILTKNGILGAQVCSKGTWDEALEWVRRDNPSGTSLNWVKDERPEVAPVKCAKYQDRTHYLFTC